MTRTPRQRPATLQPDPDADVLAIEFDNEWEGPGDAFQSIVDGMAGLEIRVTPADGSPAFDALLIGGNPEFSPASDDRENAAVVEVRRLDDRGEPVGEPKSVRIKALRISS